MAGKKLIYGVGINDADYEVCPRINGKRKSCHYYNTWFGMLERCYSEEYHQKKPTYIRCSVVEEWHQFLNFKKWMEGQDFEGKCLDKDILSIGNKIYSPETCVFVTQNVNSMLTHDRSTKGEFPTGVNYNDSQKKKYITRCHVNGKRKYLGRFETPEDAGNAYKVAKSKEIIRVASEQENIKIMYGLLNHAANLLNE